VAPAILVITVKVQLKAAVFEPILGKKARKEERDETAR
jgi:hypothetical protein